MVAGKRNKAKYPRLVVYYFLSKFTPILPSSLFPSLSRPPEGSALKLRENQSPPPPTPHPFQPSSHPLPFILWWRVFLFMFGVCGCLSVCLAHRCSFSFFGLNIIHFQNKALGICLSWRGLTTQRKPCLASLQTLGSMIGIVMTVREGGRLIRVVHVFWGVSFLIRRVAAWCAGLVIQSVVLFKVLN